MPPTVAGTAAAAGIKPPGPDGVDIRADASKQGRDQATQRLVQPSSGKQGGRVAAPVPGQCTHAALAAMSPNHAC